MSVSLAKNQTTFLKCEVYVPRDVNNNSVSKVRWFRSLDLVTSEDVTDEHDAPVRPASNPFMSSYYILTGLFRDLYSLNIRNISSSDNGYYWCQIITNETCLSSSPYVYISVSTVSTASFSCSFHDYESSPVCATNGTCLSLSPSVNLSVNTVSAKSFPYTIHEYGSNSVFATTVKPSVVSTEDKSPSSTFTSLYPRSTNPSRFASSQPASAGICMTELNTEYLEFVTCLGVTIPTAGFVLILIIMFICCVGIFVCRKKRAKWKGKYKLI